MDRMSAAKNIQKLRSNIPMYIDPLDDKINKAFGAFPERLYVILDDIMMFQSPMGPFGHSLPKLEAWLSKNA